jgi:beta-lactamase class A
MATTFKSLDLKKNSVNRRLVGIVFVITGIMSGIFWWQGREIPSQVEGADSGWFEPLNITYKVNQKKPVSTRDNSRSTSKFVSELAVDLSNAQGEYGLYVYRLNTNRGYGINEDLVFPAASIMKVPIMAAVFKAAEQGRIELDEPTLEMLQAMGKRSDNEAPVMLSQKVGRDYVIGVMDELGMKNSDFYENTTTVSDVVALWKKLYTQNYLSSVHLEQMWEFLSDSIFEERITAGVPEGTRVVHKVGTDLDVWADAGIVLTDDPFVVVILNDEVNLEQAKDLVPKVVKKIWDFESSVVD